MSAAVEEGMKTIQEREFIQCSVQILDVFLQKKSLEDLYRKIGIEILEYAMLYCQNESHETIEVTYKRDCTCQYRNKYSFFCAKFQTRFFR